MACVLVVDDDPSIRSLVEMVLAREKWSVLAAKNGLEALHLYSSYRHQISGIVTDVTMPVMGGFELVDRVRSMNPSIPIIVMSGFCEDEKGILASCVFLSKPFLPQALIACVRRHFLTEEVHPAG